MLQSYMLYITMSHFSFIYFCFSAGLTMLSCLEILDEYKDCSQMGLDHCKIDYCSDNDKVDHKNAPTGPLWDCDHGKISVDKNKLVPVLKVAWKLQGDGSVLAVRGSEINIVDKNETQSLCVKFSYKLKGFRPLDKTDFEKDRRWNFSLDVVVEPKHNYIVTVSNLPESNNGNRIERPIIIPGCNDDTIQWAQVCQENGSLWTPKISVSIEREPKISIVVAFATAQYSERFQVSIKNGDLSFSKNISKENRTSLNVTFEFDSSQLSECELLVMIQPFFIGCKDVCERAEKTVDYCKNTPARPYIIVTCVGLLIVGGGCLAFLLWRTSHKDHLNTSSSAAKEQPGVFQVQERKRVLIIYSLDHPLYKNIVLKFSAFLATKCGTEVVLDLLDSTRLGVLGSIQWLDWHKKQIENSSDKILILCSRGVQAKWRAMCGANTVFLREDTRSPVGDMLTPSLTLLLPHFIRSASFKKYIVAYFDDISSEEDIPSPFNITVRYQLMKQFEEVFFRILDTEKHEPGRMKQIDGLSETNYHQCPSGRALRDAIEAFHAHQLENPRWFEDEILENPDLEDEMTNDEANEDLTIIKSFSTYCLLDSNQHVSHAKTQENGFTVNKTSPQLAETHKMCLTFEFNPDLVESGRVSCFS